MASLTPTACDSLPLIASKWVVLGVLSLSIGLSYPHVVYAQDLNQLGTLEQQLFTQQYPNEPVEARLSRLENVVFGQSQTGNSEQRLNSLLKTLSAQPVPEIETPTKAGSQATPSDPYATDPDAIYEEASRPPDATDYPAVTDMENMVFRRNFAGEDITKRLDRLEEQVFKRTYHDLPMVDRVDQLTLKIDPANPLSLEEQLRTAPIEQLPQKGKEFTNNDLAIYAQLKQLEERVIGKSFGGELIINRLRRLEQILYGAPQAGSVNDRISRLMNSAARSSATQTTDTPPIAYSQPAPQADSQIQVGQPQFYSQNQSSSQGYPPNSGYNGYPQPAPSPYSNNRSGSTFGFGIGQANTAGTNQYSPDMLGMMPPHVRQHMQSQGIGGTTGRSIPLYGYGTVVTPNQQPSQQPTYPPQSNVTTPYPGAYGPPVSSIPQQVPSPQTRHEQYTQSISLIEIQVLGQRYDNMSLQDRLSQLENELYGQTYPFYTMDRRIERLLEKVPLTKG